MSDTDATLDFGFDETALWYAEHHELVDRIYRARLRSIPEHRSDGIQSFWLEFHEQKLYSRFRAEICPSQAGYISSLAHWRAVRFLHRIWSERASLVDESRIPAESPSQATPVDRDLPATRHILQLVAINRLPPREALVLLCKEWTEIGPIELSERHLGRTLFQLCGLIESRIEAPEDETAVARQILATIREQLSLPVGHPLGDRTLQAIIEEFGHSRVSANVLLYWLDQARRICHSSTISSREHALRLRQVVLEDVAARLKFIVQNLSSFGEPEKLLVWALERVLNLREHSYGELSCIEAAEGLIRRIRFIYPQAAVAAELPAQLAGAYSRETVLQRLAVLHTDAIHVVRAIEERYRRFQRKGDKDDG
jgi:hypothetical protein